MVSGSQNRTSAGPDVERRIRRPPTLYDYLKALGVSEAQVREVSDRLRGIRCCCPRCYRAIGDGMGAWLVMTSEKGEEPQYGFFHPECLNGQPVIDVEDEGILRLREFLGVRPSEDVSRAASIASLAPKRSAQKKKQKQKFIRAAAHRYLKSR